MKRRSLFRSLVIGFSGLMIFASCSKSDDTTTPPEETSEFPKNETWVVYAATSGWSGGIYTLKENKAREVNLANLPFFQLSSVLGGRTLGKTLYKVNSASNAQGILKMNLDASNKVVEDKFLPSPFLQNT